MDGNQITNPAMAYETTGVSYISPNDLPWVPWELGEGMKYRLFKVDPVHGTFSVSLYVPADTGLGLHHHTGFVQVYTQQGSWKYHEHDWTAEPGSLVYETADSKHSFTTLPGDDVITYIFMNGTLEFLDDDGNIVHTESWRTFLERQNAYYRSIGHPIPDITSFVEN